MADNPDNFTWIKITLQWETTAIVESEEDDEEEEEEEEKKKKKKKIKVNIWCEGQDIEEKAVPLMKCSTYMHNEISTLGLQGNRYRGHVIVETERPIFDAVLNLIKNGSLEWVVDGSISLYRIAAEIRRLLIHPPGIPHEEALIMVNARSFTFRSQQTQDITLVALDNGPPVSANRSVLRARSLQLETLLQDANRTRFPIAIDTTQQLQNVVNFLQGQSLVLRVWSREQPSELQEFCIEISRLQIVDRGRAGEVHHEENFPLVTDVQPPMRSGSETDSGIAQRSEDSPMDVSEASTSTGSGRRSFFPFPLPTFRKSPSPRKTSESSENKDEEMKERDTQPSTSGVQLEPKAADTKTNKSSSSSSRSPQQRDPKSRRSTEKSSSKSGKTYYPTETSEATSDVVSSDVFSSGEEIQGTGSAAAASQSVPELQSSPGSSGARIKSPGPLKSTQKISQSRVAPLKRRSVSSSPKKKSATVSSAGEQESHSVRQRSSVSSSQFVQQAQHPTRQYGYGAHQHGAQHQEVQVPHQQLARRDVATQHVATQHVATHDVATQHVSTRHVATEDVATQHVATEHVATEDVATQHAEQRYLEHQQHGAQYQHGDQYQYGAHQLGARQRGAEFQRQAQQFPLASGTVQPSSQPQFRWSSQIHPEHAPSRRHPDIPTDGAGPSHGYPHPTISQTSRSVTSPEFRNLPVFTEELPQAEDNSSMSEDEPYESDDS